jgi:hypothetical protein
VSLSRAIRICLFQASPARFVRGWLGCRYRKALGLAVLATLGVSLILIDLDQERKVAQHFKLLYLASSSPEDFALRCNAHILAMHRSYAAYLEATHQCDDITSLAYVMPAEMMLRGGACVHRSLVLCTALRAHGIPARKLLIGVTDTIVAHVVVEALLDGEWRVLDPLFGYAFRRDDGKLASAGDLKAHPELLERVVRADPAPFPIPYPLDAYNYQHVMHFNWNRLAVLKSIRRWIGPAADDWEPPFVWNWRLTLLGYGLLGVSILATAIYGYRAWGRKARARAKSYVTDSEPRQLMPSSVGSTGGLS